MREFKFVILGDNGVGKSAITIQFVQGVFVEEYDPSLEDSYRKNINVYDNDYLLEIIDTSTSSKEFQLMRDLYIKDSQGIVLVYSINNKQSFDSLVDIREQIIRVKDTDDLVIVVVGNKSDLEEDRKVSKKEVDELIKNWRGTESMEVSAKYGTNINEIFTLLLSQLTRTACVVMPRQRKKEGCDLF